MITYSQRAAIINYVNPIDVIERGKIMKQMLVKWRLPAGFNECHELFKVVSYNQRYQMALKETEQILRKGPTIIKETVKEESPIVTVASPITKEMLSKYRLPEGFNENHVLYKFPSFRQKWEKMIKENTIL